jgi:hypothetical protein
MRTAWFWALVTSGVLSVAAERPAFACSCAMPGPACQAGWTADAVSDIRLRRESDEGFVRPPAPRHAGISPPHHRRQRSDAVRTEGWRQNRGRNPPGSGALIASRAIRIANA